MEKHECIKQTIFESLSKYLQKLSEIDLGDLPEDPWDPLGSLLGASWEPLGSLLVSLGASLDALDSCRMNFGALEGPF